jgi:hypothetical protein
MMNNRVQISVRLERELNEKFQVKLQAGGWSQTGLISTLIQSFVEGGEISPPGATEGYPPDALASLLQEIQGMNRKILALEALLFLALSQRECGGPALTVLGETASSHDS